MYKENKILCLIPARGGSKGIKQKTFKQLISDKAFKLFENNKNNHAIKFLIKFLAI